VVRNNIGGRLKRGQEQFGRVIERKNVEGCFG
jgi:hypothetical protein